MANVSAIQSVRFLGCQVIGDLPVVYIFVIGSSTTLYYSKKYFKKDCHAWFQSGARKYGPYEILIAGKYPKTVVCKMVNDGSKLEGGWIMALNKTRTHEHYKEKNDFELYWDNYKKGFKVDSGHYLGNENLHFLTRFELLDLRNFDLNLDRQSNDLLDYLNRP